MVGEACETPLLIMAHISIIKHITDDGFEYEEMCSHTQLRPLLVPLYSQSCRSQSWVSYICLSSLVVGDSSVLIGSWLSGRHLYISWCCRSLMFLSDKVHTGSLSTDSSRQGRIAGQGVREGGPAVRTPKLWQGRPMGLMQICCFCSSLNNYLNWLLFVYTWAHYYLYFHYIQRWCTGWM